MIGLDNLAEPLRLGSIALANRIVMAPMTRSRAHEDGVPTESMALYYLQRSSAGLIITEGVNISAVAKGNRRTPGIWTESQLEGWKKVTAGVHESGGKIVLQLWHTGRMSHSLISGHMPVGPSRIPNTGKKIVGDGVSVDYKIPHALRLSEIKDTIEDYSLAATNAIRAGFDGVEIHGANGYLPDQFLHESSNNRSDRYGGSIENRCRFALEVTDAVIEACGSNRVGYRISPSSTFGAMFDSDSSSLYLTLVEKLSERNLAYLHVVEPGISGATTSGIAGDIDSAWIRQHWHGRLIAAGNYNPTRASKAVAEGQVDAVAFGRAFIGSPDLVARILSANPIDHANQEHYYGGGDLGYVSFPSIRAQTVLEEIKIQDIRNLSLESCLANELDLSDWERNWVMQQLQDS